MTHIEYTNAAIEKLERAKRELRQGNHERARHDVKDAIESAVRALYEMGIESHATLTQVHRTLHDADAVVTRALLEMPPTHDVLPEAIR